MNRGEHEPFQQIFENLESLADKISEVLTCPVTIEDANHRLLAYSSHEPGIDPARMATIVGRRVPEKVINSLWQEGVIPRLLESDDPIRISPINDVGWGIESLFPSVIMKRFSDISGFLRSINT
ncbi:hypothetical protein [Caldalkalibacillus mannanilyticus]|uniref:hypothetical protein n=1 Tax=Caldalkalibacillus mannanilyticus TaxID=1418 RepID=UPI000A4F10D7|nr:hypothetical protein [Caldalkalibacillus mannanilyticus]